MSIELFHGDCIEVMKTIPDKSVDMVLCDLPYGTTRNKWDSIIPLKPLWGEYKRIIKRNGAIVLFSQMPFSASLVASNYNWFRYEWLWEKSQGTGHLNVRKMPLKKHENILVFYKKLPTYNPQFTSGKPYVATNSIHSSNYGKQKDDITTVNDGKRYPTDILHFNSEHGLHPTQKPVPLLEYLIKTYSNECNVILDNCMGSGSTGVACLNSGRNFIGIEKDDHYFNVAQNRLRSEQEKMKLIG